MKLVTKIVCFIIFATVAVTCFAEETNAPTRDKPTDIPQLIRYHARNYGVDEESMLAVAMCESSLNPEAIGDSGNSRGIFQIHKKYHPDISDNQAFDPDFSAEWTADQFSKGKQHLWTCSRTLGIVN